VERRHRVRVHADDSRAARLSGELEEHHRVRRVAGRHAQHEALMTASIDIAGAVAPAPSRPAKAGDARPAGATRSANSAGRTRARGAHASRSAKAESAAADAFDAQLDAALPDAAGTGKAKNKAAATDDAPQPAPAERDSDEQARDQVATGAVLTPWTFVQPVEVTPAGAGESVATPSSGDAPSGVEPADAATGTSDSLPEAR